MYEDTHLFPTYDYHSNESIIPAATFIAKKIAALKKSFMTSQDSDERNEIQTILMFHQSVLLLLCLSFFTEAQELTDLAKEIFRNGKRDQMFLSNYYQEKALYERRLQLLDILDDFARTAFYDDDFSMKEDDPKMIVLRKQFADVLNPVDVEKSLKKIYPDHLYRPTI